jgi:TRAP transporter TAXI family solute receptor
MISQSVYAAAGLIAVAAVGCHADVPADVPDSPVLRLATGGGCHPFGESVAEAMRHGPSGMKLAITPSRGAVANVQALQDRTSDVALVSADVAYLAHEGALERDARYAAYKTGETSGTPVLDQLRAIAVLQLTTIKLVAGPSSGIRSLADLRNRNKRVAVGPEGSGLTALLIFDAAGFGPNAVQIEHLPVGQAGVDLAEGRLDAIFVNALCPVDGVAEALRLGARLIAIDGQLADQLRREYPFLRATVIRAGTYPGIAAVRTLGVETVLVCRRDLDEELVHRFTERLFEVLPAVEATRRRDVVDFAQASATPIPLHDGAARYYREQELLR